MTKVLKKSSGKLEVFYQVPHAQVESHSNLAQDGY